MSELSVKEQDLLKRIQDKPELGVLFFKKVKGLKWFDALHDNGYFEPKNLPRPTSAKKEGYVNIPRWEVVGYLVKTAPELAQEATSDYALQFLNIITSVTTYAKEHGFGNYHVWRQLSEILMYIPSKIITPDDLDVVDYWLTDKYERGLVAEVVGERWLASLLEENNDNALLLAEKLLEIIYRVDFSTEKFGSHDRQKANLRFDDYYAARITSKVASLAGRRLGRAAVSVFHSKLVEVLDKLNNDTWSCIWQPAIEDHEQNEHHNDAENVLLIGYRDSLTGYLDAFPVEASEHVATLLESPYQTVERLAIHCIGRNLPHLRNLWDRLIAEKYLQANYRHEIWHFLNRNYGKFRDEQKRDVLTIIEGKVRTDEDGDIRVSATAYEKSTWLAAIKDYGREEADLYHQAVEVSKTEPDHPDFSSYLSSGWSGQESPYSLEELSSLSFDDLIKTINTFKQSGGWREPSIEGLSNIVTQLIKSAPMNYYDKLESFANLDFAYVYSVISAYEQLWHEKANLPWDDVWRPLLSFTMTILGQDRFWDPASTEQREQFVANRHWIVSSIGRLLQAGSRSDDYAFDEKFHGDVESILQLILDKETGAVFKEDSDAVSISINSPRGHCIEALINLSLRACRLEDQRNNGDHSAAWNHYQAYYDSELGRSRIKEYEFATLVAQYLPNFLYMSKEWVLTNLSNIFDQSDYLKWLCAIQGYSYVNAVYQEVYSHLKEHGDLLRVLDEDNLKERAQDKYIQQIVVAFLNDFETLNEEDSLIRLLLKRRDFDELNHLIWFIWTIRAGGQKKMKEKVFELWPMLIDLADPSSTEGRRLASQLCLWADFVEQIDSHSRTALSAVAPFADESHNSYKILESLARLSDEQPFEANEIWRKVLQGSAMAYPEEAIRRILTNLVSQGAEGRRAATETVSEYLKQGTEGPYVWLNEITKSQE